MLRLSFALVAVFATFTNGYRFVPSRGGPVVDDPASSFVPESPEEEPVVVAPAARIVQLGPRPYYLVDSMKPSFLKDELSKYSLPWKDYVKYQSPLTVSSFVFFN
jgi:hypothetical protein